MCGIFDDGKEDIFALDSMEGDEDSPDDEGGKCEGGDESEEVDSGKGDSLESEVE